MFAWFSVFLFSVLFFRSGADLDMARLARRRRLGSTGSARRVRRSHNAYPLRPIRSAQELYSLQLSCPFWDAAPVVFDPEGGCWPLLLSLGGCYRISLRMLLLWDEGVVALWRCRRSECAGESSLAPRLR